MAVDLDPSARLCVCGTRGCDLEAEHCNAFVGVARGRKGQAIKHRRRNRSF
jgi:hypothetical protein